MLSAATLALLFCLNSSGTTYFDGGSADALTTALARATHGTVMIETASAIVLPAMALNTESTDTLGPSFLKGPLWLAAGTDYVLSDGAYVRSHFGTLLDGPAAVKTDSVPQSALNNGSSQERAFQLSNRPSSTDQRCFDSEVELVPPILGALSAA